MIIAFLQKICKGSNHDIHVVNGYYLLQVLKKDYVRQSYGKIILGSI